MQGSGRKTSGSSQHSWRGSRTHAALNTPWWWWACAVPSNDLWVRTGCSLSRAGVAGRVRLSTPGCTYFIDLEEASEIETVGILPLLHSQYLYTDCKVVNTCLKDYECQLCSVIQWKGSSTFIMASIIVRINNKLLLVSVNTATQLKVKLQINP